MRKFIESFIFRTPPEDIGEIFVEWEINEFNKHERNKKWYIVVAVIVTAILVYAVLNVNYLLGVIILLLVFILIFQHYQEPKRLAVKIGEDGLMIGNRYIPHVKFSSFWLAYDPPVVKNLYFDFANGSSRHISVPLEDANPLLVREILEQIMDEDLEKENEVMEDYLSRKFKI